MSTEPRLVPCPNCSQQLRLKVPEEKYGKELEVSCPSCLTKFRTTIMAPSPTTVEASMEEPIFQKIDPGDVDRLKPILQEFGEALNETISASGALQGLVNKIKQVGYNPLVILEAAVVFRKRDDPTALVTDGEVAADVFTDQDRSWLGRQKIRFDDN